MNIGITGHQELSEPADWRWVRAKLQEEITREILPIRGYTSLAKGADQLFADLIIAAGGELHVVIPFDQYARTLSGEPLRHYYELLGNASTETLNVSGTDEDAFLAAGRRIVDLVQLLLAVWNGRLAKGKGGTADVVAYSLAKHIPVVHINPTDHTVQRLT